MNAKCCTGRTTRRAAWVLQLIAAAILAQTLYFKFSGAEESRFIFSRLGVEPWGRVGTGMLELVAVFLLLTPRLAWAGALFSCALMTGAIGAHLTRLGIVVQGDGGLLFGLAATVFAASGAVAWLRRSEVLAFVRLAVGRAGLTCPVP